MQAMMDTAMVAEGPFSAQTRLSANQKLVMLLVGLGSMLEFWDAYLIGFVMGFLVKPWALTFGTMSIILLASGVGAIVGGLFWGTCADRIGRKPVFVGSIAVTGFATLALAFTPDRGWLYMAAMRVLIGFGTGGFFVQIGMIHEFLPPRRRGMLTGIVSAITTAGLLLGAVSGAFLVPAIGWRGTFALGGLPLALAVAGAVLLPESPRWLLLHGRREEARRAVAWALGEDAATVDLPPAAATPGRGGWGQVIRCGRSAATSTLINLGLVGGYYGIVLWSPTLLAQIEGIGAGQAARIMIGFSLLGFVARLAAARMADAIGRRRTGGWLAIGAALFTLLAGLVGGGHLASPGLFWLPVLAGFLLADGSFSVCALYSTEIWPSRLRRAGAGLGSMAGSVGKIVGPLGLGLIAGSGNVVMPGATAAAVAPAFAFLAACLLVCGMTYLLLGIELRQQSLEQIDAAFAARERTVAHR